MKRTPIYRIDESEWDDGCDPFFYEMQIVVNNEGDTWIEIICTHGFVRKFDTMSEAHSFMEAISLELDEED